MGDAMHWTRRRFLKAAGLGGVSLGLGPLLPHLGSAQHRRRKRLILIQTGNGTVLERWRQNGDGRFVPGEHFGRLQGAILGPLDRHRNAALLLDGVDYTSLYDDAGRRQNINHGHAAASVMWTGLNGGGASGGFEATQWPTGPSVDQFIAGRLGETAVPSIQLGVWNRPNDPRDCYSFDTSGVPLRAILDPRVAFDTLFSGFASPDGPTPDASSRRRSRRRAQFALLRDEHRRLQRTLSASDRQRLERHADGLRELERRLDAMPSPPSSSCTVGNPPDVGRFDRQGTIDAHLELITRAFSCDRTRVVSLTLCPENHWDAPTFVDGWTGGSAHPISHAQASPNRGEARAAVDAMTALCRWQAEQVADLVDRLKSVEEAPGETLFDNTTIVWSTAMSHGGRHVNRNAPIVILQGSNGGFATGRYLRFGRYEQDIFGRCNGACVHDQGGESSNRFLVSLCHEFGLDDVESFGDPRFSGPLGGLLG